MVSVEEMQPKLSEKQIIYFCLGLVLSSVGSEL